MINTRHATRSQEGTQFISAKLFAKQ
jgi:hypothetical protein